MRDLSIHYQPREHLRLWVRARVRRLERRAALAASSSGDGAASPPPAARDGEGWVGPVLLAAAGFCVGVVCWRLGGPGAVVAAATLCAVAGFLLGRRERRRGDAD